MPSASFCAWATPAMAEQVILGENGLIEGTRPGTIVADASTISPSESRKIGGVLGKKGVHYLDAPCTGSTPGANAGTLTFMVGGDQALLDKIRPWLEPMGKRILLLRRPRAWACRPSCHRT